MGVRKALALRTPFLLGKLQFRENKKAASQFCEAAFSESSPWGNRTPLSRMKILRPNR